MFCLYTRRLQILGGPKTVFKCHLLKPAGTLFIISDGYADTSEFNKVHNVKYNKSCFKTVQTGKAHGLTA